MAGPQEQEYDSLAEIERNRLDGLPAHGFLDIDALAKLACYHLPARSSTDGRVVTWYEICRRAAAAIKDDSTYDKYVLATSAESRLYDQKDPLFVARLVLMKMQGKCSWISDIDLLLGYIDAIRHRQKRDVLQDWQ